jgi:thiol peroxidase
LLDKEALINQHFVRQAERNSMSVKFGGNPVTLAGTELKVGDTFPEFTVTDNDLGAVKESDTKGPRVFLAVPSLDTAVCDLEVRTFNTKVGELPGVSVYAVSMDLPFAQARWCGGAGVEAVKTLSDYKDRDFGQATGTYMKENGLLARAVFVVDADNKVSYVEYVPEVTTAPDYDAAYKAVAALI